MLFARLVEAIVFVLQLQEASFGQSRGADCTLIGQRLLFVFLALQKAPFLVVSEEPAALC